MSHIFILHYNTKRRCSHDEVLENWRQCLRYMKHLYDELSLWTEGSPESPLVIESSKAYDYCDCYSEENYHLTDN